ncbi:condensation domain-containing protein [Streptomyces sp. NBC_01306]|uniref:condensation domain-containing protein n=1 Tax=Streptomyces sp. NBC_01306 TaxID=2903819 RepID=UPI00225613DA|nr:condensation domain-containing protein [Streptomyces sp. NBC_01306]MCX4725042.1 condensation domain-containing protein [Streptomyces sp. NBC_01306]
MDTLAASPADLTDTLLAVLREALAVPDIDLDSGFYALGGDSLTAVKVVGAARARGIPLTLRDLMVHQTPRAILGSSSLRAVPTATAEADLAAALPPLTAQDLALVPEGVQELLPASALQTGMLYLCQTSGDPRLYHTLEGWEVCAPFDEDVFRGAVAALGRRYAALRTSFDLGNFSAPAQLIWEEADITVTVDRARTPVQARELVDDWCENRAGLPFDWMIAPLLRCHVVTEPDSFHVVLACHHAVLDGWSLSRLTVDLMVLYWAASAGREARLPAVSRQPQRDFLINEYVAASSSGAAAHWLAQVEDAVPLFDGPRPGTVANVEGRHVLALGSALVTAMRSTARILSVSVKAIALAAHARALGTWSGRERDIVTGVVFPTRPETAGADLAVGLFLNTLPVRFTTVDDTWTGLARAAAAAEQEGAQHAAYPQALLVEQLGRPAFDVSFNFMDFRAYEELDRADSARGRGRWVKGKLSFPFCVNVDITGEEGQIRVSHDASLVPSEAVRRYADLLRQALTSLVAHPVSPAAEYLRTISEAAR